MIQIFTIQHFFKTIKSTLLFVFNLWIYSPISFTQNILFLKRSATKMKKLILIIYLSVCGLGFNYSAGANFSSITDGGWAINSTWGGSSHPDLSIADNISINTNDSVYTTSDITIKSGGYLTIKSGGILVVNDMEFSNGSHITVESGGKLIIKGNFTNKNNSDHVVVNGSINVSGNFDNGNGGIVSGTGAISVNGNFSGVGYTFGHINNSYSPHSTAFGSSLPVEFIGLSYIVNSDNVELNWETASEIFNDFFTVEKSLNGTDFEIIGTVKGSGYSNSIVKYNFFDENISKGICYYRLSQTDYDGTTVYLKTIVCKIADDKKAIIVFQNPVVDQTFQVNFSGESGKYLLNVYNENGQIVLSEENITGNNSGTFNVNRSVMKGYYVISITDPLSKTSSYPVIFN
jgi:hypothetical protein